MSQASTVQEETIIFHTSISNDVFDVVLEEYNFEKYDWVTIFGERRPGRAGGELGIQLGSVSTRREVASVLVQLQNSRKSKVTSQSDSSLESVHQRVESFSKSEHYKCLFNQDHTKLLIKSQVT